MDPKLAQVDPRTIHLPRALLPSLRLEAIAAQMVPKMRFLPSLVVVAVVGVVVEETVVGEVVATQIQIILLGQWPTKIRHTKSKAWKT